MLIKKFDEYNHEELIEFFNHWWHYYGKTPYTQAELERFNSLLEEDMDFVKKCALIAYAGGVGSKDMIDAWRGGHFDRYRMAVENTFAREEVRFFIDELESSFIKEVVNSYNNPEPDVSLSFEQIMNFIDKNIGVNTQNYTIIRFSPTGFFVEDDEDENSLSSDNVCEVYKDCLLEDSEVSNNMPLVDFVVGEGVRKVGVFNSSRLALNKDKIINMIDSISNIDNGLSFLSMSIDKDGFLWTGEQSVVDLLVQLGVACEVLEYPLPREMWEFLPGGVPLIVRNHNKDREQLRSHKPKEFTKVVNEVNNGTYRRKDNK